MQTIGFSEEYVKSVSLDDFKQHFADNGYDWSDTDITGYWQKYNPTVTKAKSAPTPKNDSTPVAGEDTGGKK